jgi:hypothetical protein
MVFGYTKPDRHIICDTPIVVTAGENWAYRLTIEDYGEPNQAIAIWLEDNDANIITLDSAGIERHDEGHTIVSVRIGGRGYPVGDYECWLGMRDANDVASYELVKVRVVDMSGPVVTGCMLLQ